MVTQETNPTPKTDTTTLYLDLLKRGLLNSLYPEFSMVSSVRWKRRLLLRAAHKLGYEVVKRVDPRLRTLGKDWPLTAHTMIGRKRLDNIQFCVEEILRNHIPGDLMETGVWRGGACIFMRGILKAYGVNDKKVWVADSFEGLPAPTHKIDDGLSSTYERDNVMLAVSLEQVQENFKRYGLLDDQVRFLKGWFKDTLPTAPISSLALLRLDGDLYESTLDSLTAAYPKISVGGYLIVDDYSAIPACQHAVDEYRSMHKILDPITRIDDAGIFWQRRL